MLSKNSSVSCSMAWRRLSSKSGKSTRSGACVLEIAQVQPLAGEIVGQSFRFRIGQHALHLLFENRRVLQLALAGEIQQLIVGNAAPQEERQARSQFQIVDAIRRAGHGIGRIGLEAEQEFGARQNELERRFDAGIEAAVVVAAALVEAEQLLQIAVLERTAISAARQCREDLARAGQLILSRRPAGR